MVDQDAAMMIGELAKAAGVTTPTVRYYEEIGLMPAARRTAAGQRFYGRDDLSRLTFLRRCRDLGFPLERVRELADLSITPEADCLRIRDTVRETLEDISARRREMEAMESQMAAFVASCETACCGGPVRECVALTDLHSVR